MGIHACAKDQCLQQLHHQAESFTQNLLIRTSMNLYKSFFGFVANSLHGYGHGKLSAEFAKEWLSVCTTNEHPRRLGETRP